MVVGGADVLVGVWTVVLGAGAAFGAPLDAEVATPYPKRASRAMAASGPTHRGPPVSSIVVLWARSPNASVSRRESR